MLEDFNLQKESDSVPTWALMSCELYADWRLFALSEDKIECPTELTERCARAANLAFTLAKLRRAHAHTGFLPLSFSDYFAGIANIAEAKLGAVFNYFGVDELSTIGPTQIFGVARLASATGINLREALLHLRIGFLGLINPGEVSLLTVHKRSGSKRQLNLADYEEMLSRIESRIDDNALSTLRKLETLLETEFGLS